MGPYKTDSRTVNGFAAAEIQQVRMGKMRRGESQTMEGHSRFFPGGTAESRKSFSRRGKLAIMCSTDPSETGGEGRYLGISH